MVAEEALLKGRWCPLPKDSIWQGVVTCSFNPTSLQPLAASTISDVPGNPDSQPPHNDQYIGIELGDNVQLLEEYWQPLKPMIDGLGKVPDPKGSSGNKSGISATDEELVKSHAWTVTWFRGYIFPSQSEAIPKLAVFPSSHVYCRALIPYRKSQKYPPTKAPIQGIPRSEKDDHSSPLNKPTTTLKSVSDTSNNKVLKSSSRSGSVSGLYPILVSENTSTFPPIPASVHPTHETDAGSVEPLADEIAAALREWGSLLKKHVALQDYALFSTVKTLFHLLFQGRRQLLSQTLSQEELIKYRRTLVSKLEAGNFAQSLDLIIRHPDKGHLVGEKSLSVVKLLKMHIQNSVAASAPANSNLSQVWLSGLGATSPLGPSVFGSVLPVSKERMDQVESIWSKTVNLSFQLKSFRASICLPGEFAELSFFLYNKADAKVISEEFLVCINYNGYPKGMEDGLARLKTNFTDLNQKDFPENVFLVCRVVRVGKMNVSDKDTASTTGSVSSKASILSGSFTSLEGTTGFRRPFGCAVLDLSDLYATASSSGIFGGANPSSNTSLNALSGISSLQTEGSSPPRDYLMRLCIFPSEGAFTSFYNEAGFPTLHENIINKTSGYESLPNSDLTVTLSLSANSGIPGFAKEADPFGATLRMGMAEMIYPGDIRNSIYLTLMNGEFTSRTTLLSARNVQVLVQVRLPDGTVVPDCIYRGAGYRESFYESVVFYHSNNPRWLETIRIDLEPEVLERAHVYFAIRHCSSSQGGARDNSDKHEKTFAFGFLPLLRADHTVINDAAHSLNLYKYDKRLTVPGNYLSYQAGPNIVAAAGITGGADNLSAAADAMAKAPQLKDFMLVRTSLYSSRMTQCVAILNLLHWRHAFTHLGVPVEQILKEFSNIPDFELVKFLESILISLFDILESVDINKDGRLDDLIFSCVVYLLSLVVDRRFSAHGVVVDSFIERWVGSSRLSRSILTSFCKLVVNPSGKELRDAIKVWGYWIRFVVRSGLAEQRGSIAVPPTLKSIYGDKPFMSFLKDTLQTIESLMSSGVPEAIASQTLALQHFPQLLPDLAKIYGPTELVEVVVRFADSVRSSKTKLNGHKLAFIHTLIRGPLFADRRSRLGIVSAATRWISEYLSGEWERDRDSLSPNGIPPLGGGPRRPKSQKNTDKDNLRLCLNVAAEAIDKLQKVGDRLDRLRVDDQNASTESLGKDVAVKEEEFRKCLTLVARIFPIILEAYADFVGDFGNELSSVPATGSAAVPAVFRHGSGGHDDIFRSSAVPNNTLSISTSVPNSASTNNSPMSPIPNASSTPQSNAPSNPSATRMYLPAAPELAELGGIILSTLHLLPSDILSSLLYRKATNTEISGIQVTTLLYIVLQSLMRGDAFPDSWVAMHVVTSKLTVKVLRTVFEVLTSDELLYSDHLDDEILSTKTSEAPEGLQWPPRKLQLMWSDYLRILLQLLNSKWLAVESFSPQRARVSQRLGGDVRGEAGELLRDMWEFLTGVERSSMGLMTFIPNLVGPFLELTLSPHPKLRVAAVELLFSTIEREHRALGEFSRIEMECIDRMDRLIVQEGKGDDAYRRFVVEALGKQFTTATKNSVVAAVIESSTSATAPATKRLSANGGDVAVATSLAALGARFLSAFDKFLELLITVRDTPAGSRFDDERIATILKLIRFLRDIGRKALYVKYVHSLARLHLSVGNTLETALTLKLHADLLPWSHAVHVDPVPEYGFPRWQTSFERKEQIFMKCIELFEQSNHWERAGALSAELAAQYAKGWLDYNKYADYLKRQARLVESVLHQERYHPTYYRVGFYGRGFNSTLRNKQFIYRGGEWEKLGPFCERILNKYVGAQLVRTNAAVGEDILNGAGSWVQITYVNPEIDIKRWGSGLIDGAWLRWESSSDDSPPAALDGQQRTTATSSTFEAANIFLQSDITYIVEPDLDPNPDGAFSRAHSILDKLPEPIRSYYLSNEIEMFSFSRPFKKPLPDAPKNDPATEFMELWTEKTLLFTADSFPCLDRRSEVIKSYTIELSPIENAVITVRAKNRQLLGLEKKYEAMAIAQLGSSASSGGSKRSSGSAALAGAVTPLLSGSRNVNTFTMALNGAVDAPVNGGVPMYRKAFLSESYRKSHASNSGLIEMLEKCIEEQVVIIQRCLAIHDIIVPSQMRPLHENLIQGKASSQKEFQGPFLRRPSEKDFSGLLRNSAIASSNTGSIYNSFSTQHLLETHQSSPRGTRGTLASPVNRPRRDSGAGSHPTGSIYGNIGFSNPIGGGVVGAFAFPGSGSNAEAMSATTSPVAVSASSALVVEKSAYKRQSMASLKSNDSRASLGSQGDSPAVKATKRL
ncbi:hypothetical protein HDU97_003185 [Phlyctochytrium planicorne]|nr:hypothetical protein HDU97_003185 [Phlyctochytrium planicorne]